MKSEKKLTGLHVFLMLAAFFGVMLTANAAFVVAAVNSFPGEIEEKSYLQGLQYNETLEKRAKQKALGWRAELSAAESDFIEIKLFDAAGDALSGIELNGTLRRPVTHENDQEIEFVEREAGVYQAQMEPLSSGVWMVAALAEGRGEEFEIQTRIILE